LPLVVKAATIEQALPPRASRQAIRDCGKELSMNGDSGSPQRRLNIPLYPASTQVTKRHHFHGNQRFEPLPPPTGVYPYRLRLEDVVRPDQLAQETDALVFHAIGDTGGIKSPEPQQIVAYHMENDFSLPNPPAFLYHLGDVVYYNGAYSEYYPQFYEPYAHYPAPILAIPGNHDGDPLDPLVESSLSAFTSNFCAPYPHLLPEAQEVQRDAMTQPNVYWTLVAPLVTIVGLYTNVPEGGRLDEDQIDWLQSELSDAASDRALLVALHHPVYSADAHHGGSARMGEVLDAAIEASGRTPDLILAAHVHNYQRFTRRLDHGELPYIVAGAGGYWHLHYMAKDDQGQPLKLPWQTPDADVRLDAYCEDRHGYLRVTATRTSLKGEYVTVPRPQESWRRGPVATADSFELDLRRHVIS
jgi:acid phosphatase type 7